MEGTESLKLYGHTGSPYLIKVVLALKLKGIDNYEYIEEDVMKKERSPELLKYNPVYRRIPVFVHNGIPILESSIIVEYIEENWKQGRPLLPQDLNERARVRFWAKFADEKITYSLNRMMFEAVRGQGERAAKKLRSNLKVLERGLEGRRFFDGDDIGFADIAIGWIGLWASVVGEVAGQKILDGKEVPILCAYFSDFMSIPIIKDYIPSRDKVRKFYDEYYSVMVDLLSRPRI